MPFDRTRLGTFREILRRLADDYGVTSEKLVNEIADERSAKGLSHLHVSRSLLDRVKTGKNTRKIIELGEIWDYVAAHPRYRVVFDAPEAAPTTLPPDAALAEAIRRFFPENREGNTYHLRDIRGLFVGRYAMYRPLWRSAPDNPLIQISQIDITDTAYGLQIAEIQDFTKDITYFYYQKDEGVMFPYGKYIYFMTREMGGDPDQSAVKLGVIDGLLRAQGLVQSFHGVLFGSSNLYIYPAARFFCRRTTEEIKADVMREDSIPIREARQYLMSPILSTLLP